MTRLRGLLRRADTRWLLAVLLLAFAARAATVVYAHPDPRDGRYDDSVWYDTTARRLAEGKGYVFDPTVWKAPNGEPIYPNQTELTPTALWPPGYSLTLAGVYKVTGNSLWAARILNVIFGTATVGFVFLIARRLLGVTAAAFAGGTLAIFPGHVLFTAVLLSETYFGFLLSLLLFLLVYFVLDRPRARLRLIVGVGALTAFAGYTRGEFMAYGGFIAVLVLLHFRRRALFPILALAFGAALVVTPWTIRNRIQFDQTIVGTTGVGGVLFQGHNDRTDGGPSLEAFWRLEQDYAGLSRKEIELKANKEGSKQARQWAKDHKLRELKLISQRMYMLFRSDDIVVTWVQSNKPWFGNDGAQRIITVSSFMFYGMIVLALAGWPLWWRTLDARRWAVFGVIPFYMIVFGVLFIGDPRYHYAMYFPLAIFSSAGMAAAWRLTASRFRQVAGGRSLGSLLRTYGTPAP